MSRFLSVLLATLITLGAGNAAQAACNPSTTYGCIKQPCTTLGATQMNKEKSDILACLQVSKDDTNLIWKSNSGGGGGKGCDPTTVSWTTFSGIAANLCGYWKSRTCKGTTPHMADGQGSRTTSVTEVILETHCNPPYPVYDPNELALYGLSSVTSAEPNSYANVLCKDGVVTVLSGTCPYPSAQPNNNHTQTHGNTGVN